MDIENMLARLSSAPLEQPDLSRVEASVMCRIAEATTVIRSQTPIRFCVMATALVVGVSLGHIGATASTKNQYNDTAISGAHLAPSALLARSS